MRFHKHPGTLRGTVYACLLIVGLWLFTAGNSAIARSQTRGMHEIHVTARTPDGAEKDIRLYSGYYALVIGCSEYRNGWRRLPNGVKDAREVTDVLKKLGFDVKLVENPGSQQLNDALNGLVPPAERDRDRAILVYFAGHGHTLEEYDGKKLGYIVPVDAPHPDKDPTGFLSKAVSMQAIEQLSTLIKAKHVLMAFDSCFSGSIFRGGTGKPSKYIQEQVVKPVRAFIAAGDEDEMVPDESLFKASFIQGLSDGYADRNDDNYITGSELGAFIVENVINYSEGAQHPRYGTIKKMNLDKGDFVFASAVQMDRPGSGTLSITCNVPRARVLVDGREIGITPIDRKPLDPGKHRIVVEKGGYERYRTTVSVSEGRSVTLQVLLKSAAAVKGRLYVSTEPEDAEVHIADIKARYQRGMALTPGDYVLAVSAKGYENTRRRIGLEAGEDKYVDVVLSRSRHIPEPAIAVAAIDYDMVYIEPGTFMMGSPLSEAGRDNDEGQHQVTLTKGFYMGATEITQGQWRRIMGSNPSRFKNCGDDCPVEQVSWNAVQDFIGRLNKKEGTDRYRLPTEAEWEYAARAGTTSRYSWGDKDACSKMMYENDVGSSEDKCVSYYRRRGLTADATAPVKSFASNVWGLYDMHGNVYEWVQDWYGDYPDGSVTDPVGPQSGSRRVIRGGCWRVSARFCRSANRLWFNPGNRDNNVGFRLARTQ